MPFSMPENLAFDSQHPMLLINAVRLAEMGKVQLEIGTQENVSAHNVLIRYVDGESGRQSDIAHHYVCNQAANTNLKVLDRHRVVKVIFEYVVCIFLEFLPHKILSWLDRGDRAVGIEYVDDTVGRSGGATMPIVARASRLVVLSAGAFGSPAILERSGIGAKSVLEKYGVKQRVDLQGVGEHYMGILAVIKLSPVTHFRHRPQWRVSSVRRD